MTQKRAALGQVNLVVGDMDASVAFYRTLGIEIPATPPEWAPHHRAMKAGEAVDVDLDSAAFAAEWNAGWPAGGTGVVLGFRVETREDVDALYRELTRAGHPGQQPPYDAFWGARYAVVLDPSGNAVGLMSPAAPERRAAPPTPPDD